MPTAPGFRSGADEGVEFRASDAENDGRIGAELAHAEGDGADVVFSNRLGASLQRARQDEDRIHATHFTIEGDRRGAGAGDVIQCAAAFE
jgi:hypothetical protein